MILIDTHAHIFLDPFKEDLDDTIYRARQASVEKIYMPNIDSHSIEAMIQVEDQYPDVCMSMIGLHPCSVKEDFENELKIMENWLSRKVFAGIGETGTDYFWDKNYIEQQEESLAIQIRWAKDCNIPIILHSRESLDETIRIIEKNYDNSLGGIFHCFNGNAGQALRIIDLGFYLGIGGLVTFKNADVDVTLQKIPLSHIVLETDSPYLAPVPFRGKRNEPSYILNIAGKLAEIYSLSVKEIARITTQNAEKAFKVG